MFSNPQQNVARLGLKEGMLVADFGAGTGFYTRAASYYVGHTGKIYAVEIQRDLIRKLEEELINNGISNVECVWGDIERRGGTKIADKIMDAVIVSNVLFQVEDRLGLLDEAKRILKPGGRALVVDWKDSFNGMGPTEERIISKSKAENLLTNRGFKIIENVSVGDHHYGIIISNE